MEASFVDEAELVPTVPSDVGPARLGVMWAHVDPPEVELAVMPRGADDVTHRLRPGDTFPIGTETWRLDGVWPVETYSWRVVVRRIDDPATAPPVPPPVAPGSLPKPATFTAFGSVAEADIRGLEAWLGRDLPVRYRRWLASTNGGYPDGDAGIPGVPFTLFEQRPLLGIHSDDPSRDLWHAEGERRNVLTNEYVVIGRPSGGLLTVRVVHPYAGEIGFLSETAINESPAGPSRATYLANQKLRHLAEDIEEFVSMLRLHQPLG